MEFRFTLRDNGMRAAFQLLHMVLEVSLMKLPTGIFNVHVHITHEKSSFWFSLTYSIVSGWMMHLIEQGSCICHFIGPYPKV